MKYFTKEWYELMQRLDYTLCMKPIADKSYSDSDIAALYDKKLKADIARDRKEYNTPPQFVEIDFDECELDDFCTFDVETGTLKHPESLEEVKRAHEREKANAEAEFAARPPFDPAETIDCFKRMYEGGLENGYLRYPDWVRDEVDIRLIALGYLPKSVFGKLKAEQKRNKAEFDRIERAAHKTLAAESKKIPARIAENFGFHDGAVLALEESDGNLIMSVRVDGIPFDGETPYVRITFVNGKISERDDGLDFKTRVIRDGDIEYTTYCIWLYEELYKTVTGYEAHMLLVENDLKYLTISCSDIIIAKNVSLDENK